MQSCDSDMKNAFAQIEDTFKQKDVVLLHGITSSGKTHVYVKLIEAQLEAGKQVLLLLPEIALASQIVKRIKKYLKMLLISNNYFIKFIYSTFIYRYYIYNI